MNDQGKEEMIKGRQELSKKGRKDEKK